MAQRRAGLASLGLVLLVATGCAGSGTPGDGTPSGGTPSVGTSPLPAGVTMTTAQYLPGVEADVLLPANDSAGSSTDPEQSSEATADPDSPAATGPGAGASTATPVVVLVPGGGWWTADRSGLLPLAGRIAAAGMVAVPITYRAGADGATFPVPAQDVACAAGFAREQADQAGFAGGPIVLLGHSAGGHLAALVAVSAPGESGSVSWLSGGDAGGTCPYDIPQADGLVGLAGVYDLVAMEFAVTDFMGSSRASEPDLWASADPDALVSAGHAPADLEVLLLHGDADSDVPIAQSEGFAAALSTAGLTVEFAPIPGATHSDLYQDEVVGPQVVEWLSGLR